MKESGYYPPGAEFDPRAPYNEPPEREERKFDVCISQTLSKSTSVSTTQYILMEDDVDTSDVNWKEEYADSHYTPIELINILCVYLKTELEKLEDTSDEPLLSRKKKDIMYMISECSGWIEDDTEIIPE